MYDVESYGHARPNHTELPKVAIWVLLADRLLTRSGGKGRAGGLRRVSERRHARNDTRYGQVSAVNPLQMQYVYIYIYIRFYMLYIPIPSYTILYHPIPSYTILYHLLPSYTILNPSYNHRWSSLAARQRFLDKPISQCVSQHSWSYRGATQLPLWRARG